MSEPKIGYARVSAAAQGLTAQRNAVQALGVEPERIYVDHGLTGTNRARPGLGEALAACRSGDVLVVTKLDRLARSCPDARDIVDELTTRKVKLSLGGSVHDPTDPVGRLLFDVLAMVAESESDLIRMRTREGFEVARAAGKLRGRKSKLSPSQELHLVQLHQGRREEARRALRHRPLDRLPSDRARTGRRGPGDQRDIAIKDLRQIAIHSTAAGRRVPRRERYAPALRTSARARGRIACL